MHDCNSDGCLWCCDGQLRPTPLLHESASHAPVSRHIILLPLCTYESQSSTLGGLPSTLALNHITITTTSLRETDSFELSASLDQLTSFLPRQVTLSPPNKAAYWLQRRKMSTVERHKTVVRPKYYLAASLQWMVWDCSGSIRYPTQLSHPAGHTSNCPPLSTFREGILPDANIDLRPGYRSPLPSLPPPIAIGPG
jgi:hypothetical protein